MTNYFNEEGKRSAGLPHSGFLTGIDAVNRWKKYIYNKIQKMLWKKLKVFITELCIKNERARKQKLHF